LKNKSVAKNIKKRLARFAFYLLLVIISLPLVLTMLFRSPLIQTLSARIATKMISQKLKREITIESLSLSFYDGLYLAGLKAYDHKNNPILVVNSLKADPDFPWLNSLEFDDIEIDGALFTYGKYKGDNNYAFMMFLGLDSTSKSSGNRFQLDIKNLRITNSTFRLFDETKSYSNKNGIDYANIVIDDINGYLSNFQLINDSVNSKILMLSVTEKSGMKIQNLACDFAIGPGGLKAYNSIISTKNSQLNFDLDFFYTSYSAMGEFIDSVEMRGEFRNSQLDLSDLGYFSDVLFQMPDKIGFNGTVYGKVNELTGENILLEYGNNTSFSGSAYIRGLPDFYDSYITLGIHEFKTSKCDMQSFVLPIEEQNLDIPFNLNCTDNIAVTGNFIGYYGNFESKLFIKLPKGHLDAIINFNENKNDSIQLNVSVDAQDLDIGRILSINELSSPYSFSAYITAKGKSAEELNFGFNSLINSGGLLGYNFKRVKLVGDYHGDTLNTSFRLGDKNLMALGSLRYSAGETPYINFESEIANANLNKLGLWQKPLHLSSNVKLEISGFDIDKMEANLILTNTNLIFYEEAYAINSLLLSKSFDQQNASVIKLESDIADAKLYGDYKLSELSEQTFALINNYYPITNAQSDTLSKNTILNFEIKDGKLIHDQLVKGLEFDKGSKGEIHLDFEKNTVDMNITSDKIDYYGIGLFGNTISAHTSDSSINVNYSLKSIILKDSTTKDKTVLGLDDFNYKADIANGIMDFNISWLNTDSSSLDKGLITGSLSHDSLAETLNIDDLDIFINGTKWIMDTLGQIRFDTLGVKFEDIQIVAGTSQLEIDGRLPNNESDTLSIKFDKWNLSYFDILTIPYNMDLDGLISGTVELGMIKENPTIISNVKINKFQLNGEYLGQVHLLNTWDNVNESIYLKGQIIDDSNSTPGEMFLASGYYYPFSKGDMLKIDVKFKQFKLPSIEPFLNSYVAQIKGTASGNVKIRGTVSEPVITGQATINETSLIIKYLNTRYSFSNVISFEKDMIRFDKLILYDTLGNTAQVRGYLKHQNFKKPWLDVNISTDKLLFFNTTRQMNDFYYGTGILSGDIKIQGAPSDIKLNITTTTKRGTKVYLPLDYTTELSDKDYIVFIKSEADSTMEIIEMEEKKELLKENELKYNINLKIGITPTARIEIAIPSNMGSIEAQGKGDLKMEVNSDGDFKLFGEYIVERGLFNFTVENLVNKRFELVKGGRISWTGDPYTAIVNIKGLYKVKANLSSLGIVIDSSASYKNKVNVECYINLKDKLLDPSLKFEIKMPDLDPDLQRLVYAELDTTNAAMMNQQMISLLVLGSFSFGNASGIGLSTSYYTVLTNQLSGMLSQISEDFDIGVNYKPGDNVSNEEWEVALSTQLFDDRLIIDGNFGVSYDRSHSNASNIVGDVDIAYKLTADGRWIMKVFNHSNVNSWYYYNNYDKVSPYTQGIGIAYRKEFNTLKELFTRKNRRLKVKKDK